MRVNNLLQSLPSNYLKDLRSLIQNQFGISQNLQKSPIPQTNYCNIILLKQHTNSSDQCWFVFVLLLNDSQAAVLAFQQQNCRQNKSDFFKTFLQEFHKGELVATRQRRFFFVPLKNDARACCYFGFSATNYRPAKINLKQSFLKIYCRFLQEFHRNWQSSAGQQRPASVFLCSIFK